MVVLQFAIGAVNDLVDAPADAGRVPAKPIPAGLVPVGTANVVVGVCVASGLSLAASVGAGVVVLALVVLAIGAAYDLAAKGTAWSWLPFAVGIPVLPVYGWYGATGALPAFFAILIPMAVLGGAALAIANARADLERDQAAGVVSVATRLGLRPSWWADAGLMSAATSLGFVFVGRQEWGPATWALVAAGTGLVVAGVLLGTRDGGPARQRSWEVQAVGVTIAAVGWIAGMTSPGL
jgi:4-hydroxybenzoate polyprenyltransferase